MNDRKPILLLDLYLIRHAQSQWNALGSNADANNTEEREDPVLTNKGLRQANCLGQYFADFSFDAVYSSCMKRTIQTAKALLSFQPKLKTLILNPVFTEFNISPEYNGIGFERMRAIYEHCILDNSYDYSDGFIAGSSDDDEKTVLLRAAQALTNLTDKYRNGEKVAVISHAGFITNMLFSLFGFHDFCPDLDISFDNTGITEIKFYQTGTNRFGDVIIEYINRTNHLQTEELFDEETEN